jgi:class 3 adenylate cyclase
LICLRTNHTVVQKFEVMSGPEANEKSTQTGMEPDVGRLKRSKSTENAHRFSESDYQEQIKELKEKNCRLEEIILNQNKSEHEINLAYTKELDKQISSMVDESENWKSDTDNRYKDLLIQYNEKLGSLKELKDHIENMNKNVKYSETENKNLSTVEPVVNQEVKQLENQVQFFDVQLNKLKEKNEQISTEEENEQFSTNEEILQVKSEKLIHYQNILKKELSSIEKNISEISKIIETLEYQQKKFLSTVTNLNQSLKIVETQIQFYKLPIDPNKLPAPTGNVTIVFTDIQGSSSLWNFDHEDMETALFLHNIQIQNILRQKNINGFEVKTIGDCFMCAFNSPTDAVNFALEVQLRFLLLPWPKKLLCSEDCKLVEGNDGVIFKGLRIKIGIFSGKCLVNIDSVTHREDYFGPTVNIAARMVSKARGGMILVTSDIWENVNQKPDEILHEVFVKDLGDIELKGFEQKQHLMVILPEILKERMEFFDFSNL